MNSTSTNTSTGTHKKVNSIAQKKKTTEKSNWTKKVMNVIENGGEKTISLPALKKAINECYGIDMSLARNKMNLKHALVNCVETEQLKKVGGSYRIFGLEEVEKLADTSEQRDDGKYNPPVDGNWLCLGVKKREKAKSGRSSCKSCDQIIEKGSWRLDVVDESLFKMCIAPGDHHEGVSRGYVECVPPDGQTVSRKSFFIHEGCLEAANEKFEIQFRKEWEIIRPHWDSFHD